MTPENVGFNTGVIKGSECVKEGWALIKDQYWLFLGIVFVGIFIGGAVPIVLLGPMMVGIYLCFFRRMRGERVEFGDLFKGFDYFAQSLIAALIQMIPMVIIMVPMYIVMFAVMMMSAPRGGGMGRDEESAFLFTFFGVYLLFLLAIILVAFVVAIFFMFAFPLIADKNMSGVEAVKLSIKAGKANLGGIVGLLAINFGLSLVGALCCYVGAFFVAPVVMASYAVAYRRVFPEGGQAFASPPPPPSNWAA